MANVQDTNQALAGITDEGLFERLATDVLRTADSLCAGLSHPGVNAQAKTKKAPVDGVCFVRHADPPHLVLVHHTITAIASLERKWLFDPASAPKRGKGRTVPLPGDVAKSAQIVREERNRTPDLHATLILTTNQEPGDKLVRDVRAAGAAHGIDVDIWSRSRIAYVLDNSTEGQWLRRSYLDIEQERLSAELLREISVNSLRISCPPDDPRAWVGRSLDRDLRSIRRPITFIAGDSGSGKTVACYRLLKEQIDSGRYGIVLPHEVVATSISIEQAIFDVLHQLHPALATGQSALTFCTPDAPLLVVVEDVNRSGQAQRLTEKIARWAIASADSGDTARWRLLCPVWPQAFTSMADDVRRKLGPMILLPKPMSSEEGQAAVAARASMVGRTVSDVTANAISTALGHDPLLIALHDMDAAPDSHGVIGRFIDASFLRAQSAGDGPATELSAALIELATQMLTHLQFGPTWKEVTRYPLSADVFERIRRLTHREEVIRLQGHARDQVLLFRHDRVRDWLLVEAAMQLDEQEALADELIADPFLAEVIGATIARRDAPQLLVERVLRYGPLALFHAFRVMASVRSPARRRVLDAIKGWTKESAKQPKRNSQLHWECLSALARTDDPEVPGIVQLFPGSKPIAMLARLHNGDVAGGADLCATYELGSSAYFRDAEIAHAKLQHGASFLQDLKNSLSGEDVPSVRLGGLLELAGYVAEPELGPTIHFRWINDSGREERLAEYLWAFAKCCDKDSAARYLAPIFDAWSRLSEDRENGHSSPKDDLALYSVDWAFAMAPPISALGFILSRATRDDLNWQITYMLRGVDHPLVLEFMAEQVAEKKRASKENSAWFSRFLLDQWSDMFGHARSEMSDASRQHLLRIWQDQTKDKYLREAAFDIWAMPHAQGDIAVLQDANLDDDYTDRVIQQRLTRGDMAVAPYLARKVNDRTEPNSWWWQYGKHVIGDVVIDALDGALSWRSTNSPDQWSKGFDEDWQVSKLLMLIPALDAERLLTKHWNHLQHSREYIQAALFVCTPELTRLASDAISHFPEPAEAFKYLSMHLGIKERGHPGLTREAQIVVLEPYFDLIDHHCLMHISEACNDNGWFDLRRRLLDSRVNDHRYAWSRQAAFECFDDLLRHNHPHFISLEIDDALKTGAAWEDIRDDLMCWLEQNQSILALQLVADAISHKGTRADLNMFETRGRISDVAAQDIVLNTVFSVQRRSI